MTPLLPGLFAAFAAGLLSFLSPCVLPLIPVYLSFISGESAAALKGGTAKRFPLLIRTLLFVGGFSLVFVLLAVVFGGGMRFIGSSASLTITRIAGVLVIILGFNTLFDFIPFLRGDYRIHTGSASANGTTAQTTSASGFKAVLLGMAFAAGWTPCIGPILSSILLYAGQSGTLLRSTLLLALYSLGLGIPFILTGLFLDRALPVFSAFKRHMTAVKIVSAMLLLGFGLAMLTGGLSGITVFFLKAGYSLQDWSVNSPLFFRPAAAFLARWFTFQGL